MINIESLNIPNLEVLDACDPKLDWILDLPFVLHPQRNSLTLTKDKGGYTLEGENLYEYFGVLNTVQKYVHSLGVKNNGKISVIKYRDEYYLLDGTHRFVAAASENEKLVFDCLYLEVQVLTN